MNEPPDESLPFRLKQSTFRLYEAHIAQAIRQAPEPVNINPGSLRATTFAARLRDAILSFDKYRWPSSFSSLEFDETRNTGGLTVSHNDHSVILGPRASRKAGTQAGQSVAFNNPNDKRLSGLVVNREITNLELTAFCVLLAGKLIAGPVILEKNSLNESDTSNLESQFDIAITSNDKDQLIII